MLSKSILFNLHVYWDLPVSFVLLISSLILLWADSRYYVISFHLNLLRCILWFQMWSVLVNASCEFALPICFCILSILSIRALSLLIRFVLNSLSGNSNIPAMSLSFWCLLCLFQICRVFFAFDTSCKFFLKVRHDVLSERHPTFCNPMVCSPSGSSVHGILQVRLLEWVAIAFSRGSSPSRDRTWVSYIAGRFFTIWATSEPPR